jgi:hypothetical protein
LSIHGLSEVAGSFRTQALRENGVSAIRVLLSAPASLFHCSSFQ